MKNNKKYIVYKHTTPSGKIYIGITYKKLIERSGSKGIHYKKNKYFYQAILKYGWNNIKHEVLYKGLTKEEACEKEQFFIKLYKSNEREFGYNFTTGGEIGYSFTKESRELISQKIKECWNTEEYRNKNLKALKGSHIGIYTDLQKEATFKRRGIPLSPEHKTKLKGRIPWNKGLINPYSLETLKKMRLSHKGKSPSNKGIPLSEERKKRISKKTKESMNNLSIKQSIINSNKKRTGKVYKYLVYQYDLNYNLINIHKGIANAGRNTGINKTAIANCIYGKSQTSHNYIWKKIEIGKE